MIIDEYPQLKKRVMRRIYLAYLMRKARHPMSLQLGALLGLGLILSFLISLKNVVANALSVQPSGLMNFFADAFLHTQIIVQVVAVAVIIIALAVAANIFRKVSATVTHRFISL